MPKLIKPLVEGIKPGAKDLIVWDSELKGFGLRVKPSGVKSFIVQYRIGKGRKWPTRRITIGQFGPLTVEQARTAAKEELASVTLGANPRAERDAAAKALTVSELCQEYLLAAAAGSLVTRRGKPKAPSTLEIDRGRIARHIEPLVGGKRARDLTTADVRRMFEAIAAGETAANEATGKLRGRAIVTGGRGTAKKAVTLLRAVLTFGVREKHLKENVAVAMPLPSDGRRSVEAPEQLFRDLGAALAVAEARGEAWQAVSIIRLLALTGMRREEAVALDWAEIDFGQRALRLRDSKTGESVRPLGEVAFHLLHDLRVSPRAPRPLVGPVFPASRRASGAYGGLPGAWRRITASDGLDPEVARRMKGFTPHHLRHALITVANRMDISEATSGKIVGHGASTTTARYISHALDEALFSVTDKLVNRVAGLLNQGARAQERWQMERLLEQVDLTDHDHVVLAMPRR